MKARTIRTAMCAAAIVFTCAAGAASSPPPHLSGGIGIDSQEALKAREQEFNLKLVFTLMEGNYLADVKVAVTDAGGKRVLDATADGPFFLARLPAGQYEVAATYENVTRTRKVKVGERLRTEYFRWPSNPATDLPVSRWLEPDEDRSGRPPRQPAPRATQSAAPAPEMEVVANGVGENAQARLKAIENRYNLKLVFTLVEGNYVADVGVAIKDAGGRMVVERRVDGPILLARLPAGSYTVAATYDGRTEAKQVRLAGTLRTEYFRWPSKPGIDFPLPPESRREP